MLTLISLLLVLVGSVNWFCIGLLQFDFVAGLFGSQSSIFSRIVYFLVGVGAGYLAFTLIKNKGKLKFNFKKLKKKAEDKLSEMTEEKEEKPEVVKKETETKVEPANKSEIKTTKPKTTKKTVKLVPKNYSQSLATSMAEHSKEIYKPKNEE